MWMRVCVCVRGGGGGEERKGRDRQRLIEGIQAHITSVPFATPRSSVLYAICRL